MGKKYFVPLNFGDFFPYFSGRPLKLHSETLLGASRAKTSKLVKELHVSSWVFCKFSRPMINEETEMKARAFKRRQLDVRIFYTLLLTLLVRCLSCFGNDYECEVVCMCSAKMDGRFGMHSITLMSFKKPGEFLFSSPESTFILTQMNLTGNTLICRHEHSP